jgi:hypothetical protein
MNSRRTRSATAKVDADDLAALRVLDPKRLLDRGQVGGVERRLARAVEPFGRRVDPLLDGRVGHLLDADGDLRRR